MPEQPGDHQGYRQRRPSPSYGGDDADYADPASDPYGDRHGSGAYYRQEPRQQPPDQAGRDPRAAGAAGPPRRRPPGRPISSTLGLTLLGTVIPGFGLIVAGRRRLGSAILVVFVFLAAFLAWFG